MNQFKNSNRNHTGKEGDKEINHLDLEAGGAGGGVPVRHAERVDGAVPAEQASGAILSSSLLVVNVATELTGATDERTSAAAFGTRGGTTSDDRQRGARHTVCEK